MLLSCCGVCSGCWKGSKRLQQQAVSIIDVVYVLIAVCLCKDGDRPAEIDLKKNSYTAQLSPSRHILTQ